MSQHRSNQKMSSTFVALDSTGMIPAGVIPSTPALPLAHASTHSVGGSDEVDDVLSARGLRTTTGPTVLEVGAVADGEYLKRVGATIVGALVAGVGDSVELFTARKIASLRV